MGLDMYLKADMYVSKNVNSEKLPLLGDVLRELPANLYPGSVNISKIVAYWRKANAIHGWFVKNVQGGKDECEEFSVRRGQLLELKTLCERLLANRDFDLAKAALPPQKGFFFGSQDSEEDYWEDLESTVKQLGVVLLIPAMYELSYQASW